jgi:Zn-dependent peptidase ImmA (M78 family)/DNA-binding XRE family transcriptional regulator
MGGEKQTIEGGGAMQGNVEIDTQALRNNLRRLREAKGYTQKQVAQEAGISVPGYQKLENGKVRPRRETLVALAEALDTNIPTMLREVEFPTAVRFRAAKKLRKREQVLARVANWLEDFNSLEELLNVTRKNQLVQIINEVSSLEKEVNKTQEAARLVRTRWELEPDEPISNICNLFDSKGIKVLTIPLGMTDDGFFGLSVNSMSGGPAIVVNTWERIPVERWIFSAAHELGHLVLHGEAFDVCVQEENVQEEREADQFASWFLMPEEAFESEWRGVAGLPWLDAILAVKRIFKVSWKTVVRRLIDIGEATSKAYARFYIQYTKRFGRKLPGHQEPQPISAREFSTTNVAEEPDGLTKSDFPANQLERLVRLALEKGEISLGRAASIIRLPLADMRDLVGSWGVEPA